MSFCHQFLNIGPCFVFRISSMDSDPILGFCALYLATASDFSFSVYLLCPGTQASLTLFEGDSFIKFFRHSQVNIELCLWSSTALNADWLSEYMRIFLLLCCLRRFSSKYCLLHGVRLGIQSPLCPGRYKLHF